jgi:hypothetical protein
MAFLEGEMVILNDTVKQGLPCRIGERAVITDMYYSSPNYDYIVKFDDEDTNPVKESELNKLTKEDEFFMEFIFTTNKVKYHLTDEIVTVVKVDYLNKYAEVKFDDGTVTVVSFRNIIKIENHSNENFKYKIGDKVKVHTNDHWNGFVGIIEDRYVSNAVMNTYDITFDEDVACFDEYELELVEENHRIDEIWDNKSRSERHREIIEEIHKTFIIKNADYGNSFGEQFEEHGLLSAIIRLDDKMRRLKQLNKQQAQVKDESIRDTVLDLANYAIMTVMELDNND